ncbi:MAG: hypothetical protein IPJ29_03450 [Chitinophagaceae bacterium]|nr:hypothetical protein [Chitinophagaceae bacterium]
MVRQQRCCLVATNGTQIQLAYNPFNVANNDIVGTDGKLNPAAQLKCPDDLDWTKDLVRTGSRKDYAINFSGGDDKFDYFLSFGYLKEEGLSYVNRFRKIYC